MPSSRILFQGDLFYVPERGRVPAAFVVIEDLAREIARRRIEVASIVGVHGRAASYLEFQTALQAFRGSAAIGSRNTHHFYRMPTVMRQVGANDE